MPEEYLAALPEDRREVVSAVRDTINANLEPGFEETMQYGMVSWVVPLDRYPDTYNGSGRGRATMTTWMGYRRFGRSLAGLTAKMWRTW